MIIPVISEIIEKYQINLLSLSRDYIQNPIKKNKSGVYEDMNFQDLSYLYKDLNLPIEYIRIFTSTSFYYIQTQLKLNNLEKSKDEKKEETKKKSLLFYNSEHPTKSKIVKENFRKNYKKKTGYEYPMKNPDVKLKIKQSFISHYGVDNPAKVKEICQKRSEIYRKNYGKVENPEGCNRLFQRRKSDYKKKTGYEHPMQNPEIKEKIKNAYMIKTGYEHNWKNPDSYIKCQKTWIEKYGVDNPTKNKEIREKQIFSTEQNLGVKYATQNPNTIKIRHQNNLKKYGVIEYTQTEKSKSNLRRIWKNEESRLKILEKRSETLRKNNSNRGATSKIELELLTILKEKFPDTIHQYVDKLRYPFNCDFYIPSLDLFIEYQGGWHHGKEPFNEDNPQHLELYNLMLAKGGRYEKNYKNWRYTDPYKRKVAKENNLNFLEFFTKDSFMEWYNNF